MKKSIFSSVIAFVCNMIMVYVVYAICQLVFFLENYNVFAKTINDLAVSDIIKGSLIFDTSAILYTNTLYAVMMLIPLHYKETAVWQKCAKWLFVIVNSICITANLIDCVYFQYTGRRTTGSVFQEFSNEDNLGSIFAAEIIPHWYLFLIGFILFFALWKFYKGTSGRKPESSSLKSYYIFHTLIFLIYIPLTIGGMRGGLTTAVRPITISNANQYVNHPSEAALILNTPFSLIRTFNKTIFEDPGYFSREELNKIYSPVFNASQQEKTDSISRQKNVVVLIMESFGREYIGAYNKLWGDANYKTYTPFTDSLFNHCLSFDYTFANGRKSIDGMPSILSGIPRFLEPFFLTSASLNDVSGIAGELKKNGYYTAFFHGAENGSMGFQAFARATGFRDYYGRTEYNQDKRFNGDKDFDGTWAIWDEEFLQFFATKMGEFKQPFMTAVFTATSHQPYVVPDRYKDIYKDEGVVIHKCIRYVDNALRLFFENAKKQPWYENTVFVITSDHTNLTERPEYETDLGVFGAPILFFDPSGDIEPQQRHCIAQQSDIMPTILNFVGYDKPYVAFGCDLLNTADEDTWAANHTNCIYQFIKGDYVMQFDGNNVRAVYDFKNDWFLKNNLKGKLPETERQMERQLKAIIQSYMERMVDNELIYRQ